MTAVDPHIDATGDPGSPTPVVPGGETVHKDPPSATGTKPKPKPTPPSVGGAINSGLAIFGQLFQQYGLPQSLLGWVKTMLQHGASADEITIGLYERPEFKARFPGMDERTKNGLAPMSPAEYIAYENSLRQQLTSSGIHLPVTGHGFDTMVADLMGKDISIHELVDDRLGHAFNEVNQAPAEVRAAAAQLWGLQGDQALASYFLDPERALPELLRNANGMVAAGTANQFGFTVSQADALRYGDLGGAQHPERFQAAAQLRPLYDQQLGDTSNVTEKQGLEAALGNDATSQAAVERKLLQRKAAVTGDANYEESNLAANRGLLGLGSGPNV